VTVEGVQKLKRSFLNLKLFSIISVNDIIEDYGYTYSTIDDYGAFIVNEKILALIKNYTKSKRIRGIIYSNPNLNESIVENLYEQIEDNEKITEFVLIDEFNIPKLQHLYPLFNEIIFFPSIKKVRLIECKSIRDKIDWKV
jgi:hypothetical protein